ncbi:hypothetical protein DES53_106144 [Roseimicrobium gellanilyticum]|uniref:Uncharacterized protein n=1 Tax=Roseimicrobium gellanilyticum TaxID=748857 RepID=A0A366HI46_9BACT|nr:hypothetical protein [Roseimicrobium gellanilyticum]RBP42437.1 hypothetical protein DES53_106144 [Roseimicrobium gellanilyticum]
MNLESPQLIAARASLATFCTTTARETAQIAAVTYFVNSDEALILLREWAQLPHVRCIRHCIPGEEELQAAIAKLSERPDNCLPFAREERRQQAEKKLGQLHHCFRALLHPDLEKEFWTRHEREIQILARDESMLGQKWIEKFKR